MVLRIDEAILDTNCVICDNIAHFGANERGLLSQNILSQIRNFVEYIAIKAYANGYDADPGDYDFRKEALEDMKKHGDLRFLYLFHRMLQKSVSHYTLDRDGSERLMLKYYEYLLKIKIYLWQTYRLEVLQNIDSFPLNTDRELSEYYCKIAEKIDRPSSLRSPVEYKDRYYVQKVKPFFVNHRIYYEITFTTATASTSKFDRIIAFTQHEIVDNYAVKFSIHKDSIQILNKQMSILVIDSYMVSIRPCEWENLARIFGVEFQCRVISNEYQELMTFLSTVKMSLTELVSSDQVYYKRIKNRVTAQSRATPIYDVLDKCRDIIVNGKPGSNVIRYLLYRMNNRIIKGQYANDQCELLSNLYLSYGCKPFETMPYCTSLRQHNPRIYDLISSIPIVGREHELFARYIKNNTEIEGKLFTTRKDIQDFENIDELREKYNRELYRKHVGRRIEEYRGNLYILEYVQNSAIIIKRLQELSLGGVSQYTESVDSWISRESYTIDDPGKKEALRQMFSNSHVALIYGSAGTGKSTLIDHIASFWADKDKIFLANTHPAVDNMRRKVKVGNSSYCTIAKFLSKRNSKDECDVLFIDECSTVSNDDMKKVLEKARFKLLVLVGDIYQIESIYFGNWFSIAQKFVPKTSVYELTHPYRTTNNNLLTVWDRVRKLDDSILEPLVKNKYVTRLNDSIFTHGDEDEIILCLNYDGLYGINNINRFLQNNNPGQGVVWGLNIYKVGDPILFNESNIFSPLIHNNSKGRIAAIRKEEQRIWFDIELDQSINEIDAWGYQFKLIGQSENGRSIIRFSVDKYCSTDEDEADDAVMVPFQVAYAISIHKAQGLEYDSVKIVITNESEERITHNIFYTAITRAKNKLKIYWSPETEKEVLSRFEVKHSGKDACLLSQLVDIPMRSNGR